jgi:CRISPR-associated exonuclease Cas4
MDEIVAISSLNQYVFCPRRCALMHVEGVWADNAHTLRGAQVHEHADARGYEIERGVKLLRAVPLYSRLYSLSGRADIVEQRGRELIPVEYKKGPRRKFDNDEVQLCAQALCLEEMFHTTVERGFIFHAASKRRREVVFTEELRRQTQAAIAAVHELLANERIPPAELKPRCQGCSLRGICLPELTDPNQPRPLAFDF